MPGNGETVFSIEATAKKEDTTFSSSWNVVSTSLEKAIELFKFRMPKMGYELITIYSINAKCHIDIRQCDTF